MAYIASAELVLWKFKAITWIWFYSNAQKKAIPSAVVEQNKETNLMDTVEKKHLKHC